MLALIRVENEARSARSSSDRDNTTKSSDNPTRSQSRSENQNAHSSGLGSPHTSVVNASVPEDESVSVESGQSGAEPEFQMQPDDEASPSDEHPPLVAMTGGPELVDCTPSGPRRELEIPGREDDTITRDRPAEEEMNQESPAAVKGRSSE